MTTILKPREPTVIPSRGTAPSTPVTAKSKKVGWSLHPLGLPMAVLISAALTGCVRWEPSTVTPEVLVESERPSAIRVTVGDGGRHEIEQPVVLGDSIFSEQGCDRIFPVAGGSGVCAPGTTPVALAGIEELEVRRVDVVGGSFLGVLGVLLLVVVAGDAMTPF
ncbi:MAG: hypothetical protein OEO79_18075 [Gemmatimonadota bacterium]|nr:hypothetical protein [Gemmatimonadota bacterium]